MSLKPPSRRGSILRVVLWLVSLVVLLGTATLVLLDWGLRQEYEPALGQHRHDVSRSIDFFCEQQELLAKDPWFHEPRTEGDASPLLSRWLPWGPRPGLPRGSPLDIPSHLPRLDSEFKDWLTSQVDVSSLDFEWMRRLQAYDRWDILRNTPFVLPERVDWLATPLPNLGWLRRWSQFRLMHGLRTGQPVEAAKDVRHLAWMAYRSDTIFGGLVAAQLLRLEREAYDSLKEPPSEWRPMSHEQVARMTAIIGTSDAFSSIASPAQVAKRARHCGAPAVGGCIGLAEASIPLKYLRPLAEDSYREAYVAHAEDLAEMSCATSTARIFWERGRTLDDSLTGGPSTRPRWMDFVPASYARKYQAGWLITVGASRLGLLEGFQRDLAAGRFQTGRP
ncbi:hypothetical protein [Hyalangium gracile]|uniref:hypothetical protein n=1 Tax=Hyalangium gracile TaxID=394092 RepID=UPI001CC93DBC|nr:hypothetical protein [Hyalangium gracile]